MTFQYKVTLDVLRDGLYIMDISEYVIEARWSNGIGAAFQFMADESSLELLLNNESGKFSPEQPDNPLAPFTPNQRVMIQSEDPEYLLDDDGKYLLDIYDSTLTNNDTDYTVKLYIGWVTNIQPEWSPTERILLPAGSTLPGTVRASISGIGPKRLLQGIEVSLGLYTDFTADELIRDVLTGVQFPAGVDGIWKLGSPYYSALGFSTRLTSFDELGTLDTGLTVFPFYGDTEKTDAYQMIAEAVAGELGWFFFDRRGRAVFWNRQHLMLHRTIDYTVVTNDENNAYLPTGLSYEYGGQYINSVAVSASPRMTEVSETLWTLDTPLTIPALETVQFDATLRKTNGQFAGSALVTVGTSTFSSGTATVAVEGNGNTATVTIVNANAVAAVLATLTLVGQPLTTQNEISVLLEDEDYISAYGRRRLQLDFAVISDIDTATSIANFELRRRNTIRGNVNALSFRRIPDGTSDEFFRVWNFGDRIHIQIPELYHTGDYFIIGEDHSLTLEDHTVTFFLEPAWANTYWLLGVDELNVGTTLAY